MRSVQRPVRGTRKSYKYFAAERAGDVLIVALGQSLNSLGDSDVLEEQNALLNEVRDPAVRAVIFDFANVEYFNSLVLNTLCDVWKHLHERGAKMALCNLSELGAEILSKSRLNVLWHAHSSRLSALEALNLPATESFANLVGFFPDQRRTIV